MAPKSPTAIGWKWSSMLATANGDARRYTDRRLTPLGRKNVAVKHAIEKHGVMNTYYLHNARCIFRFTTTRAREWSNSN